MGQKKIKRVVIDTNVLVSALLFDGTPGELIPLWKEKHIEPVCSKAIIDEYLRVLAYPKFQLTDIEIDFLLTVEILPWFQPVTFPEWKPYIKKDPHDDIFIRCALEAKAEVVISGDSHLLNMKNPPVPVCTVVDLLNDIRR